MDITSSNVCKMAKNAFKKYVYSSPRSHVFSSAASQRASRRYPVRVTAVVSVPQAEKFGAFSVLLTLSLLRTQLCTDIQGGHFESCK